MATTDRNILKSWFERGKKPLASQFAAWIDSYWHKDDTIPVSSIENLSGILGEKIDQSQIDNIVNQLKLARPLTITMEKSSQDVYYHEPVIITRVAAIGVESLNLVINGEETAIAVNEDVNIAIAADTVVWFEILK
jgi:hypothetical protein